jgi:hypothetical protein
MPLSTEVRKARTASSQSGGKPHARPFGYTRSHSSTQPFDATARVCQRKRLKDVNHEMSGK